MTVQAGLCQTWWETRIVGFLTHRLKCIPTSYSVGIFEPPRGKTNNVVFNRSDTNRPVQSQMMARGLKFWI